MSLDGVLDQNKKPISNNETHFVSPITCCQYFIKKSSGVSEFSFFKYLITKGYEVCILFHYCQNRELVYWQDQTSDFYF